MITDFEDEDLSKQEPTLIESITDSGRDGLLKQEANVIKTIIDQENRLLNQEPSIIKTITDDGRAPNDGAASQPLKKGLKKEKIKDLLKQYSAEYDLFFSNYPRKIRKKEAYEIWIRLMKENVDPVLLTKCAENYAAYCSDNITEEKYILHASTFLNPDKERYMDYLEYRPKRSPGKGGQESDGRNASGNSGNDIPTNQQSLTNRFTRS